MYTYTHEHTHKHTHSYTFNIVLFNVNLTSAYNSYYLFLPANHNTEIIASRHPSLPKYLFSVHILISLLFILQ